LGHGSFTYALLESLQIQGENNCATVERLCKRLKDRVLEINREYKKPVQTPYTRIEPETKNHLIFLPERIQPTRQDISTLRENALKAEFILNNLKLAEVLWTRLVIYDLDEALESLLRIRQKLQQSGFNSTVSLLSQSAQFSSTKQSESAKDTSSKSSPQILTETLSGNISLEMLKIPAGSFTMGSDEYDHEKPKHQVKLQEFYLGKYSVTQEQYQAVMGNNPSNFKDNPKNPVEQVSWEDAQEFCKKLNQLITGKKYRLPTEAEWEYACRAGTQTRYYFGDDQILLKEYAWYGDNSGDSFLDTIKIWDADPKWDNYYKKLMDNNCKTHPVGQKKPNEWGLYDMSGNVWEWCEDPWHDSYTEKPQNIKDNGNVIWLNSNESYYVLRGGSWYYNSWVCRSAFRGRYNADVRLSNIGFRLVVSAF
jgi:formylglycine-generating enzyme required for sulfatase activity